MNIFILISLYSCPPVVLRIYSVVFLHLGNIYFDIKGKKNYGIILILEKIFILCGIFPSRISLNQILRKKMLPLETLKICFMGVKNVNNLLMNDDGK